MISAYLQRKMGAMALTGGILGFVGAMFVVAALLIVMWTLLSLPGTVSAQGTILSCTYSGRGCHPTVSFYTRSGERITFSSSASSSTFAPEKPVTVRYHPDNPRDAQIDPWPVSELLSSIFAGIGLLMLIIGVLLFLLGGNHPAADLVKNYYAAFKNQDYATAYQYLNPTMRTRLGEPITQAWFTQRARAYDEERGKLTNDIITNFSLRPTNARFTVKVVRGINSYKVHLNLLKVGDAWRINGFDIF